MNHAYHPQCGCSSCGDNERARERDEAARERYADMVRKSPILLQDVVLNDEQAARAAQHLWHGGDPAAFQAIWQEAADAHIEVLIEELCEEAGLSPGEAAWRLVERYCDMQKAAA